MKNKYKIPIINTNNQYPIISNYVDYFKWFKTKTVYKTRYINDLKFGINLIRNEK